MSTFVAAAVARAAGPEVALFDPMLTQGERAFEDALMQMLRTPLDGT